MIISFTTLIQIQINYYRHFIFTTEQETQLTDFGSENSLLKPKSVITT